MRSRCWWRRRLVAGAIWAGLAGGCGGPYPHAILGGDGQPIRAADIRAILDDPDLTDAQRREQLQALGITDEDLLNLFVE